MRNTGTLSQFIDFPIQINRKKPIIKNNIQQFIQSQNKINKQRNFRKVQISQSINFYGRQKISARQRRVKTSIENYKALPKSPQIFREKYGKQEEPNNLFDSHQWEQDYEKYLKNRIKVSSHRGMNFLNKNMVVSYSHKNRPKLQQGLLRAIEKIEQVNKLNQHNVIPKEHERVIRQMGQKHKTIQKIPSRTQMNIFSYGKPVLRKDNSSQQSYWRVKTETSNHIDISCNKRIQFEQGLAWAKKHKKDQSYFLINLGKQQKQPYDLSKQVKKRRRFLSQLHRKATERTQTN